MRLPRRVRKAIYTSVTAVVLGLVCIGAITLLNRLSAKMVRPPLEGAENQVIDLAFQVRKENGKNTKITTDDIVIIDIDDASIERLGRPQNWPRSYDASVISYIASGNPKAIGVDYLYTESDSIGSQVTTMLEEKGFTNAKDITSALSSDHLLSEAIGNAGNVYLSFFDDDEKKDSITSDEVLSQLRTIDGGAITRAGYYTINHPQLPIAPFLSKAKATGSISMPTMYDGTVRHYQLLQKLAGTSPEKYIGNFPLYMAIDALGKTEKDLRFTDNGLFIGDSTFIPVKDNGTFRINWLGSEESIRPIPYYKVLHEITPSEFFENKYVFMGTSASGMQDLKTVPSTEEKMPGVEVHAIAFLNVMNGSFLKEISEREALPYFAVLGIIMVFIFLLTRPLIGFFLAFVLYFAERFIFELYVIPDLGVIFPITTLMLLTLLTYLLSSLYTYFIRERKNRILKNAFGTYVSPEIVEQIAKDPDKLQLGGEKKNLTVLFSDIRSFTSISEKLDPQQIVALLNNYLSAMSETIFRHKGTIDKFIGDAIMAIFGAPIPQTDHADRACRVALDMMKELEQVNEFNKENNYPLLRIGIGINTGDMTVGNIGSEKRFDYTVIGDPVNLGSRLEGLTKHFQVEIIVSELTKNECKSGEFIFRELGAVKVKGKDKPVDVFELFDKSTFDVEKVTWMKHWDNAFAAMKAGELETAIAELHQCEILHPRDFATIYYSRLCEDHLVERDKFDVIIRMDTK